MSAQRCQRKRRRLNASFLAQIKNTILFIAMKVKSSFFYGRERRKWYALQIVRAINTSWSTIRCIYVMHWCLWCFVLYHVCWTIKKLKRIKKQLYPNETVEVLWQCRGKLQRIESTCICFTFDKCDIISISHWTRSASFELEVVSALFTVSCVSLHISIHTTKTHHHSYHQYRVTFLHRA